MKKSKKFDRLFDVCTCRCFDKFQGDTSDFKRIRMSCDCPRDRKIPEIEWESYCHAKLGRRVMLGPKDRETSERLLSREKRRNERARTVQLPPADNFEPDSMEVDETEVFDVCDNREMDPDFQFEKVKQKFIPK